ncbi:MAG: Formamidase [Firmicutes bacterium]|nr:Formamidase [candidate division NPL-UPA2 bacterium]
MRISRESVVYAMDKSNSPVMRVPAGTVVKFETVDAFGGQVREPDQPLAALDWSRVNPATGPLYVEGAEPGDTLTVEILSIDVALQGVMAAIPGAGLFGDRVSTAEVKLVPLRDGFAHFSERFHVPLKPMIGVIGVAPAGEGEGCGVPGRHGGNMDNARIVAGTTLYLPVLVPGALLAIGDLHAVMGDGEVMVTGVECSGEVTVRVDVAKGVSIANPRHADAERFYTIASHEDLDVAVRMAANDMLDIVMDKLLLSLNEAGMLLSVLGHAEICQVVDPKMTARFSMPKHFLSTPLPALPLPISR